MAHLSMERIGNINITVEGGLKDCHHPRNNQEASKKRVFSPTVPVVFLRWVESPRILGRQRGKEMKHLSIRVD